MDIDELYEHGRKPLPEPTTMDALTRHAEDAASIAIINDTTSRSPHELVQAGIRAALIHLIENDLITVRPVDDWPSHVVLPPGAP